MHKVNMDVLDLRSRKVDLNTKTDSLVFQATSWYAQDVDCKDIDGEEGYGDFSKYIIKVFGVTRDGFSVSASITGFTPYFYVRIPENWGPREVDAFREVITASMSSSQQHNMIVPIRIIKKKEFWGFTNFQDFKFVRLCFTNHKAMKAVVRILAKPILIRQISMKPQKFTCYESNIDPYIRFIHINNLEPSGWICLPPGSYQSRPDTLPAISQIDVQVQWQRVESHVSDQNAKIVVCSFDLECMSDTGDFPVPMKDYKKLASDVTDAFTHLSKDHPGDRYKQTEGVKACMLHAFSLNDTSDYSKYTQDVFKIQPKNEAFSKTTVKNSILSCLDDIISILTNPTFKREEQVSMINKTLSSKSLKLPDVRGDSIIQIGSTFHVYGDKEVAYKNIITLGGCTDIEGADVIRCNSEEDLLIQWKNLIQKVNPDVITGYNIFGFDMVYMVERARDLGIESEFMKISRLSDTRCQYKENRLSSSALGDNILKFIDMEGRVLIDMMKVIQRDHKLDSYKLDTVANHFMNMNKNDVSPKDIFRLQRGTDEDRKVIAEYCIQDCALCNYLMMKLEILANNMGMSNVCLVPLSFIFMRGQGVKIFSLVLKQCKDEGFLIPVIKNAWSDEPPAEDEEGYEGAIVLDPKEGIYIDDPVSVLDYASLYPSSMISENLSHDCIILDEKYNNLPGVQYLDIAYDLYEGVADKKRKVGERVCRYAQLSNNDKGIIPRILMKLLGARKSTRKKMEWQVVKTKQGDEYRGFVSKGAEVTKIRMPEENNREEIVVNDDVDSIEPCFNEFQQAMLDGLQVAYKVTANSLYGQIGARTSPIYLKDIAACTTATGRKMIMLAKDFLEKNYCANIVYGDSVASYTPITLQKQDDNTIVIDTIDNIATKYGNSKWIPCIEPGRQEKEGCEIFGLNVWTADGWKPLHRVIRHQLASHKKMWRVLTHTGLVDVTDDHSLIASDGTKVSPKDLKVGSELLHRQVELPSCVADLISVDEARIMGFFMGDGSCGHYKCPSGNKYSWALNNSSMELQTKYQDLCKSVYPHMEWVITIERSGVYKLAPKGGAYSDIAAGIVRKYRSILYYDKAKIVPDIILNATEEVRTSFMEGFNDADGDKDVHDYNQFDQKSQVSCASLYMLASSLGYNVSLNTRKDKPQIFRLTITKSEQRKNPIAIKKMYEIPYDGYVYDLTTDNHQFQSGIGTIINHNTDSLFVVFPKATPEDENPHPYTIKQKGHAAIMPSIQLAIKASGEIKKLLKQPHDLEYEKTFWPFVLLSKKRYVGNLYEQDDKKHKTKSMGIVLKRRDNANIVKKIYGGVIDIILGKQDLQESIEFLRSNLEDMVDGKAPLEELIISKSLRAEYKDPTRIAHKVLAERMGERDPGNKPQVNDRIQYVYVAQPPPIPGVPKCRQPKILQGDRIEHPDHIRANNLVPDYGFYITNQIMKPVLQVYAIVADQLGIRSKEDYDMLYEGFLEACDGNESKAKYKLDTLKEKDVKALLFDPYLKRLEEMHAPPEQAGEPVTKARKTAKATTTKTTAPPLIVDGVPLPDDIIPPKKTTRKRLTTTKELVINEETGIVEMKKKKPAAKKEPIETTVSNELDITKVTKVTKRALKAVPPTVHKNDVTTVDTEVLPIIEEPITVVKKAGKPRKIDANEDQVVTAEEPVLVRRKPKKSQT